MASIAGLFREISKLVDQLDEDDFEFRAGGDVSSIRPRVRKSPPRGIRPARRNRSGDRKSGREKFEARRKIKRLNRLLKKAEREGYDIGDLIESGREGPLVRVEEETMYVDRPEAELEWTRGEPTVVVVVDDHRVRTKLPFGVESVQREGNGGITVFRFNSEG